jgi:hypothetical protein
MVHRTLISVRILFVAAPGITSAADAARMRSVSAVEREAQQS